MASRFALRAGSLVLGTLLAMGVWAAEAGGGMGGGMAGGEAGGMGGGNQQSPADQAINYRKALYTVIGGNFNGIGAVMRGGAEYNAADIAKRAERVAFLASMTADAYPEISKEGNTRAKPEIWSNRAGFDKAQQAFVESTAALAALVKTDKTNSAAFKAAAGKVGESCGGCHDNFRAR